MRDKVSIIIPTYNCEKTIEQSVESAVNQTYPNKEVIIVDDGSTDRTAQIISKKFSNVIYHKIDHSGIPGKVRNEGIKISTGRYISFLDSDDYWDKNMIAILMAKTIKDTQSTLFYGSLIYDGGKYDSRKIQFLKKPYSGYVFDKMVAENFIPIHPALVKKEVVESVGGFDENLRTAEDYDLWLRIAYKYPVEYCPDAIGYYRVHKDSLFLSTNVLERNINTCKVIYGIKKTHNLQNSPILKRLAVLNLTISKNFLQNGNFFKAVFFLYPFLRYSILFYLEKIKKCVS